MGYLIVKMEETDQLHTNLRTVNQKLRESGFALAIHEEDDGSTALYLENLTLNTNPRNAGRKHLQIDKDSMFTVRDVRELIKSSTAKETAELLGISRATLFRRLKEYSDADDWMLF